jgi:NADH-ubiquinone oxidoreductase-G iron-sulfur binding region/2Fe-2S iron-sulfur cluster binding domain
MLSELKCVAFKMIVYCFAFVFVLKYDRTDNKVLKSMKIKKTPSYITKVEIYINNVKFLTRADVSVLEASSLIGFNLSRFCYHESLSVVGTCRICLVEIEKSLRPAASCALPIINNMRIHIDTPLVKKARESVIETLLINHPLDCPICDQAGECDLQDITSMFGGVYSRVSTIKRVVEDKDCGTLIKTIMTRCIHCTRCVRFITEIAGTNSLGTFNRGVLTEIGGYVPLVFNSELSGNIIDLCPVGALTSKSYAFKSRPWDMKIHEGIDLNDSTGANTYVHLKDIEVIRVLPKRNDEINGSFISDKSRFSYDSNNFSRIENPIKAIDPEAEEYTLPFEVPLDYFMTDEEVVKYHLSINQMDMCFDKLYELEDLERAKGVCGTEVDAHNDMPDEIEKNTGYDNYDNGLIMGFLNHEDGMIENPVSSADFLFNDELERERVCRNLLFWKQAMIEEILTEYHLEFREQLPDEASWEVFLFEIDVILKEDSRRILIIVNNELDLESMDTARRLVQCSKNKIKLRLINSSNSKNVTGESYSGNKIDDIRRIKSRFCFLLCCNLKLEASILNGKLRAKYSNEDLTIYSFGHHFTKNIGLEFVIVGIAILLNFFEGKSDFSKKFLSEKSPLFFLGETFKKRFNPVNHFIEIIKSVMPTSIILIVESSCNSRGAQLMNLKSLTKRDINFTDAIIFINMDDTFSTRSAIEESEIEEDEIEDDKIDEKVIYWLNSHYSQNVNKSFFILPMKSSFETKGIFLNLEGRPQRTSKVSDNTNHRLNIRSANIVLKSFLAQLVDSIFLKHIFKQVKKPKVFSKTESTFYNTKSKKIVRLISKISTYPLLPSIENFYTKGSLSKYSQVMSACSDESRQGSKMY